MDTQYKHLTESDRVVIQTMLALGHSQRSVARHLEVAASTISREVARARSPNPVAAGWYLASLGQRVRVRRRVDAGLKRRKLGACGVGKAWPFVLSSMRAGLSPEQACGRLRYLQSQPADAASSIPYVSHETIYCAIYAEPRSSLRTELVKLLRKSHSGRMSRSRGKGRFTGLQEMTSITLRPPEVAARIVPGHWEGDLIKGAKNLSAVGTIVERTSRYIMLVKLDNASAPSALEGFTKRMRRAPACMRKSLTYDQGTEMALHKTLAKRLHIDVFFCDPHSPWQRGSNENANGVIREYLPKGLDLNTVTQKQLTAIEHLLNNRPRKILNYRTPAEVFLELQLTNASGVALQV